ncbi:MAG TPA: RidA family protein [Bacteroidota bacterium]
MKRTVIATGSAPAAIGPYSQGIAIAAGMIYTSGQIPLDPATGTVVPGGIREQTMRVLANLGAVLEASGSGLDCVVKTTVFLTDLAEFAAMNEVYASFFPNEPPARTTVQVQRLPKDVHVEIDAVAILRER